MNYAHIAGYTLVGVTAVTVATPLVIAGLGFGAAGVVGSSIAAGVQASIGNVAAGTLFASLQSAGVLGTAVATKLALGAAGGAVTGALGTWWRS
jgi:hypothetical protein